MFPISILAGLNDVRLNGVDAIPSIKNYLRSIINVALAGECISAAHLSTAGIWTVLSSSAGGRGRSLSGGGAAMYTNDANARMVYEFSGTNLIVGSIANILTTSTYRDFMVEVDGIDYELDVEGVTSKNYAYPNLLISGLSDTVHVATIRPKNGSAHTVVDFVGSLSTNSKPILVGAIPYLTSMTYAGNTITLADIDTVNAEIENVVNEYAGYPVVFIPTNDFYNTGTGISPDGIHPNNVGHAQIANAFLNDIVLSEYLTIPSGASKIIINNEHEFIPPVSIEIIIG